MKDSFNFWILRAREFTCHGWFSLDKFDFDMSGWFVVVVVESECCGEFRLDMLKLAF